MAGLYIHIPFCAKRCIYCDFYSSTNQAYQEAYIAAVVKEMEMRSDEWREAVFDTVYFGGGTPSQLRQDALRRIFDAVYQHFTIAEHPEITFEANPDDLSDLYIASIKTLPVNRISIGIQSFDDGHLRLLNRRHTALQAVEAVKRCQDAGLTHISIDLMYGLPGQTADGWAQTIEKAIALDVSHISAYCLSYEEGTTLSTMLKNNEITPAEDEDCELFFRMAVAQLTAADFVHYEISNFAKRSPKYPEGRISIHNSSYWNGTHYLGLGPSAHSYNGATRSWNVSSVADYINGVEDNPEKFRTIACLTAREKYNDFIITRLRTKWGVSLDELTKEFGEAQKTLFLEQSNPYIRIKKLKYEGGNVKLSLEGMFVSDGIIRDLLA